MNAAKTDTGRSSVISDGETNSETIDDYSQYSAKTKENTSQELHLNSSWNAPASKGVSVKINQNDDNYKELLLNESTDNMDDVMVQISKRTTVKKIITKTTSVNGVTQSNETESFFKNSEVNDTVMDNGMKSDRSPKSANTTKHTEDNHEDTVPKENGKYYENHRVRSRDNSLSDIDQIRNSEPHEIKKMRTTHEMNNGTDPSPARGDHLYEKRETKETNKNKIGTPINVERKIQPNSESRGDKFKERKINETFDIPDRDSKSRAKSSRKIPADKENDRVVPGIYFKNEKDSPAHHNRIRNKRDSGRYIHEPENLANANKDGHGRHGVARDSDQDYSIVTNQIKWVDPLKSTHLKYDLKDNGRALRGWIKERSASLRNSNPNFQMQDRIHKKPPRTESKSATTSSKPKNTHNDTKQFIIRGNLKENSFQNRHSLNRQTTRDSSIPDNTKQGGSKMPRANKLQARSYKSLENLNEIRNSKAISRYDSRNKDLTLQVSKILDKFELNKSSVKRANLGIPHQCSARCCYRDCLCMNYCPNAHVHCHPCCWHPYHIQNPIEDNYFENRKCLSYQNLNSPSSCNGRILSEVYRATIDVGANEDFSTHAPERTLNFENNNIYNNDFCTHKKHIKYLESKLSSIENKIRNIHTNGQSTVSQREHELEKQCQDIERQLVALYKTSFTF